MVSELLDGSVVEEEDARLGVLMDRGEQREGHECAVADFVRRYACPGGHVKKEGIASHFAGLVVCHLFVFDLDTLSFGNFDSGASGADADDLGHDFFQC